MFRQRPNFPPHLPRVRPTVPPMSRPPHLRKYTPHSYFCSTLRDVVAAGDSVVVIIPNVATEYYLRKRMFKLYREHDVHSLKEYEMLLQDLLQKETFTSDVSLSDFVAKRYLYLKGDLDEGLLALSNVTTSLELDINVNLNGTFTGFAESTQTATLGNPSIHISRHLQCSPRSGPCTTISLFSK
jgi:hypothetical protein